jgi:hypothetical protein
MCNSNKHNQMVSLFVLNISRVHTKYGLICSCQNNQYHYIFDKDDIAVIVEMYPTYNELVIYVGR